MSSPTLTGHDWTYQRYLQLDDEERYEIIDGELLLTPAPGTRHQRVISALGYRFLRFVEERGGGEIFLAPTDVVLSERNVIQPDILFIAHEHADRVRERAIHGPPDLAVEILSPYSIARDRHRKRALYERSAVREYWIVDPANGAIEVFALREGAYELASFAAEQGEVRSEVLEGLAVDVSDVLATAS